jgi:putative hydrolase of the HAD superfamily
MVLMTVFDIDDMLFDHRASHERGLAAARSRFGIAPASAGVFALGFERAVSMTASDVLRGRMTPAAALRARLSRAATAAGSDARIRSVAAAAAYRNAYEASARARPFASAAVRAARALGPTVLLSNGYAPAQRRKLEWCGLSTVFDAELYSSDLGIVKPSPRIFAACERLFGFRPPHICMVGDFFDLDIRPAARRGWHTAWVGVRSGPGSGADRHEPVTLSALPALLARWCALG